MKQLQASFKTHLQTLNYSKGTVKQASLCLKDYLKFLDKNKIKLRETNTEILKEYFDYLHARPNQKSGGSLSFRYILKYKHSLKLFYDFLRLTRQEPIIGINFPKIQKSPIKKVKILSKIEVQKLFKACENNLLGERDKAMLSLYYGCGLRKQEGVLLNLEDLDLDKGQLLVRKSKTGRQRYVPLSNSVVKILDNYLFNVREKLVPSDKQERAVLVSITGNRISSTTPVYILNKLSETAKVGYRPSLHTLRHSIATHLLQAGMPLESISKLLGHKSLDSTQIYTHLINQTDKSAITKLNKHEKY